MEYIKILSSDDINAIHQNTLSILEEVGIKIPHKELLELLSDHGAKVDFDTTIAKLPADLVDTQIAKAGKKHILYGRDTDKQAKFGYGEPNFLSSAGQYSWVDELAGKRREPVLEDMKKAIAIGDSLENINIVGGFTMPVDVPVEVRDLRTYIEVIKGTTKPVTAWIRNGKSARYVIDICKMVAGSSEAAKQRPITECFCEAISPLKYTKVNLDIMIEFARAGMPVGFGPMAMTMATAPGTLAGTMSVENAEILTGITMAQLINPGVPVTYWGIPHIMDPSTGNISFGSPEQAVLAAAHTQLAKHYGFPAGCNVGLTDSKVLDAQAGMEKGMTSLFAAMAGADIFGHMGICGADQGASLNQLIMDDEMGGYLRRMLRGMSVSKDTLAYDVIKNVGIGGNFLAEEHTVMHLRNEIWPAKLLDRRNWESWKTQPDESLDTRVETRKESLLADYSPAAMEEKIVKELDLLLAKAAVELKGTGIDG